MTTHQQVDALAPIVQVLQGEVQQLVRERGPLNQTVQSVTAYVATTTAAITHLQTRQVQDAKCGNDLTACRSKSHGAEAVPTGTAGYCPFGEWS